MTETHDERARTLAIGGLGGASLLVIGAAVAAARPAPVSAVTPAATPAVIVLQAQPAAGAPPVVAPPATAAPEAAVPGAAAIAPGLSDGELFDQFLASLAEPAPPAAQPSPAPVAVTEGS